MSRSYRRAFAAITGTASAKKDKRRANRGVRRKLKHAVKVCADFESLLIPHRFECGWNNTYCWARDGAQHFISPSGDADDGSGLRYYLKISRK